MKFDGGYTLTARSKDPKPLKLLLAHPNIDINRQDAVRNYSLILTILKRYYVIQDGNTPLHRALYFGNENYVKILLNDPRIDLTEIRYIYFSLNLMILSNLNITNHHDFLQYGRTPDEMNCSFNRKNGRNLSSRKVISSGNSFHSESNSITSRCTVTAMFY